MLPMDTKGNIEIRKRRTAVTDTDMVMVTDMDTDMEKMQKITLQNTIKKEVLF